MLAREFTNPVSFNERAKAFLFEREFENNLILASLIALNQQPVSGVRFFTAEQNASTVGTAILTTQGRLVVSAQNKEAAAVIANAVPKKGLRTLFMPAELAEAFTTIAPKLELQRRQALMKCDFVTPPKVAEGFFRIASMKDFKLLLEWAKAFTLECNLDESSAETEKTLRRFIEAKQMMLWETEKRPVAMAGFSGLTPRAARINQVYTEPSSRSRGFAEILVHRLTHRILEAKDAAVLFADLANKTSVGLYERLGYKTIQEFSEFKFPA